MVQYACISDGRNYRIGQSSSRGGELEEMGGCRCRQRSFGQARSSPRGLSWTVNIVQSPLQGSVQLLLHGGIVWKHLVEIQSEKVWVGVCM